MGSKESSTEEVQQLLDVVGYSIVLNEKVESIKDDLKSRGLSTEGDVVNVLIKHLAVTQLLLVFERIHSLIFGSQIFLLKKLNEVTGQGRTLDYVNDHVVHVQELYPEQLKDWSAEQYLEFLYSQLLIVSEDTQIHITNIGVEYLTWIVRIGRSDNNPI